MDGCRKSFPRRLTVCKLGNKQEVLRGFHTLQLHRRLRFFPSGLQEFQKVRSSNKAPLLEVPQQLVLSVNSETANSVTQPHPDSTAPKPSLQSNPAAQYLASPAASAPLPYHLSVAGLTWAYHNRRCLNLRGVAVELCCIPWIWEKAHFDIKF